MTILLVVGLGIAWQCTWTLTHPRVSYREVIKAPNPREDEIYSDDLFHTFPVKCHLNIIAAGEGYYGYVFDSLYTSYAAGYPDAERIVVPELTLLSLAELRALTAESADFWSELAVKFCLLPDAQYQDLWDLLDLMHAARVRRYVWRDPLVSEVNAVREFRLGKFQ